MNTLTLRTPDVRAYLQLMRPANILTAWADILAGFAATGLFASLLDLVPGGLLAESAQSLPWLLLATTGLYGGGITFNDVFDAELDAQERPERPIPSGRVSLWSAALFGGLLLLGGGAAAAQVSGLSALLAVAIAAAALLYDAVSKHYPWLSPLNMGLCRGGNLLLGLSAVPAMLTTQWFLMLIPIAYIGAVTAVSQGEVQGGKRSTGMTAIALVLIVLSGVIGLQFLPTYSALNAAPFAALFAGLVLPPFVAATRDPSPKTVMTAVKSGVLALIVLDAAIAAGFMGWAYGLLVLALLPVSRLLAKLFAVT